VPRSDVDKFLEIFSPISDGIDVEHVMGCWYDCSMSGIKKNNEIGIYGQPLSRVEVCPYIFYSFWINFDGIVVPCSVDWNREIILGDSRTENVVDIWNGDKLRALRLMMLNGRRSNHHICGKCDQLVSADPNNIDSVAEELIPRYEM